MTYKNKMSGGMDSVKDIVTQINQKTNIVTQSLKGLKQVNQRHDIKVAFTESKTK